MSVISLIQFEDSKSGRRVGVVDGSDIVDVTSIDPRIQRVTDAWRLAASMDLPLAQVMLELAGRTDVRLVYRQLLENRDLSLGPIIRPPVDHVDPYRVLIAGTGLTHLGSMQSRDQMHTQSGIEKPTREAVGPPKTDSRKMFEWGLEGGRPAAGVRGTAPEWFYKGNGTLLRGAGEYLDVPEFTLDGGEEPEIVGCYVIDDEGQPVRLGFALGNEWSDHAVEKLNYLYLAPSKLRTCAVGPELIVGHEFQDIELTCRVIRDGHVIYDSGSLWSGEQNMCHSLANMEDHHFKYPQHRMPGDVHLHYFGTSKLSYGNRDWQFQDGDEIHVISPKFSAPLINRVRKASHSETPVKVYSA